MSGALRVPDTPAAMIRAGDSACAGLRYRLDERAWARLVGSLGGGERPLTFLGLWCDTADAHAQFMEPDGTILMASTALESGRFLALSPHVPVAGVYERSARDLSGAEAMEAQDVRPWLDHAAWPAIWPCGPRPVPRTGAAEVQEFRSDAAALRRGGSIAMCGPLAADSPGPLLLRLGVVDGLVAQAEWRGGYAHAGVMKRVRGCTVPQAVRLMGRVGRGSWAAHQTAFCRAVEQAAGLDIGRGELAVRAAIAELERIGTHLFDLAVLMQGLGADLLATALERARENVCAANRMCFGHRLLMDCVMPGGGHGGLSADGAHALTGVLESMFGVTAGRDQGGVTQWRALYRQQFGQSLVGVGILSRAQAARHGIGGPAGRASGLSFDYRRQTPGYRPEALPAPMHDGGDIDARIMTRLDEIAGSARQILALLPDMASTVSAPAALHGSGEGIGCAEGPRGVTTCWVRLDEGRVESACVRDPDMAALVGLETVLIGGPQNLAQAICQSFGVSAGSVDQ